MNPDSPTDVAINVFARPFQTSLSILSLLKHCGQHIGTIWLQYEPVGMKYDPITAYCIYDYLIEKGIVDCKRSQPDYWLARESVNEAGLKDKARRSGIRYEVAFESSKAETLLLLHNDVFIKKDLIKALKTSLGDHFATGQIGQCWNCPASHTALTNEVMGAPACSPDRYDALRPDYNQLLALYKAAEKNDIFVRPYHIEGFTEEFVGQPWTLPECRVNEWACLINMKIARPSCIPHGQAWPPGAYRKCGEHNLDIGVAWFRDMNSLGFRAKNIDLSPYMLHWVGTGSNTPRRYTQRELNALQLLQKHFRDYVDWLRKKHDPKISEILGS